MESKINFSKSETTDLITNYRKLLYNSFIGPLDGMWEALYIANSYCYIIKFEEHEIGYCCVDHNKSLNQLFIIESHRYLMYSVIESLINLGLIVSAHLSSIEPTLFNSCLMHVKSLKPNTLNYTFPPEQFEKRNTDQLKLRRADSNDITAIKSFFKNEICFDDSFGYTENLVKLGEIYVLEDANIILATGECRLSVSQPVYADVGMVVKQNIRKQGFGARVLYEMVKIAIKKNREPICSTTVDNLASQKAIKKTGFYNSHTIFKMNFSK